MAPREDDHENYEEGYVEDTYDTSADDDTYVEDASGDDEWVEGEDDASQEPPPKKKKSSALTTIIIVVVAVIGVLGFMVMKGSKAPSDGQMAPADVAQTTEAAPTDAPMPADQAGQPVANGQDSMPVPTGQPTDAPVPQPAPQQGLMDNPDLANQGSLPVVNPENAGLAGAVTAAAPEVQAVSDFPTVDSIKKTEAAPTGVAPAPSLEQVTSQAAPSLTAPTEAIVPADAKSAVEMAPPLATQDASKAQLDQANAKIAELQKALSDKDSEIQKQKEAQKSPANDSEVSALKDKISELESKLSALSAAPAPEMDAPREVKPAPVAKAVKTSTKAKESTSTASKPASWVLKSAKPGHAVIANAKTGDYRSISVGDDVPGIGKVTAIGESPSGWAVQGTAGKISE